MKLEILKKVKNEIVENAKNTEVINSSVTLPFMDYELSGYTDAGQHLGDRASLRLKLEDFYNKFTNKIQKSDALSEKDKDDKKNKAEELKRENIRLQEEIDNIEKIQIPESAGKIKSLKKESDEARTDPNKNVFKKDKKISHYVGIALIISLSLYLWVFYSSAGYSSFFRQIAFSENDVLNSVFYPKALTEAYQKGFTAILFTVLIPSVFLALGFLIHKFAEIKQKWAYAVISLITLVTFLFDFIIAYEISKKLYDAASANSFVERPEYNLYSAITDVNVYMIIFAGFIVYIVWGILFYFVTESFGSMDSVSTEINKNNDLIEEAKLNTSNLRGKVAELKRKIDENETKISAFQTTKKKFIYNFNELDNILTQYVTGWNKYLVGAKRHQTETDLVFQDLQNFLEKKIECN